MQLTNLDDTFDAIQGLGDPDIQVCRQGIHLYETQETHCCTVLSMSRLLAVSREIQPAKQGTKRGLVRQIVDLSKNDKSPKAESICRSACTAALALIYMKKAISTMSLVSLLQNALNPALNDIPPLLPVIHEGEIHYCLSCIY